MQTIKIAIALVFVACGLTDVFSQASTTSDPRDTRPEYMKNADAGRERQNERVKKINEQARSVEIGPAGRRRSTTPEQRKASELEKREALEEINKLLSAPPEYGVKYAEFLKGKNTGLARIFPDRGCDKGKVVSVENLERCGGTAPIWGAGSLYSFRLNKLPSDLPLWLIHGYIRNSDIHFVDGKFVVGTESIQDIIADIGEVDLSDVTLKSDGVKFLKSFEPGGTVKKVALQKQELAKGINENGILYSTSVPIRVNRTYVLRSIAFNFSGYKSFWNTDVFTAFKVVGQEDDGSVVLLWKELKESSAPYLRK